MRGQQAPGMLQSPWCHGCRYIQHSSCCFCGCWRSRWASSCLYSKCFIHWTIFPAPSFLPVQFSLLFEWGNAIFPRSCVLKMALEVEQLSWSRIVGLFLLKWELCMFIAFQYQRLPSVFSEEAACRRCYFSLPGEWSSPGGVKMLLMRDTPSNSLVLDSTRFKMLAKLPLWYPEFQVAFR